MIAVAGALVSALRPFVPGRRGAADRARHRGRSRDDLPFGAVLHPRSSFDAARPARHAAGDRWFLDETYVKVAGHWTYPYRAVDQHGQVIDLLISTRRDAAAARRFLTRALRKLGKVSALFVDDDLEIPTWVAVRSGLDDLALAPRHDPDTALTVEQEQALFEHYNVGFSDADAPGPHTGGEIEQTGLVGSVESGAHPIEPGEIEILSFAAPGVPVLPAVERTGSAAPLRARSHRMIELSLLLRAALP